jgi:hypothetical protein
VWVELYPFLPSVPAWHITGQPLPLLLAVYGQGDIYWKINGKKVNLSLSMPLRRIWGIEMQLHSFLTLL